MIVYVRIVTVESGKTVYDHKQRVCDDCGLFLIGIVLKVIFDTEDKREINRSQMYDESL